MKILKEEISRNQERLNAEIEENGYGDIVKQGNDVIKMMEDAEVDKVSLTFHVRIPRNFGTSDVIITPEQVKQIVKILK